VRGAVTWTLRRVRGPGQVAVFQTGSFGDHDVIFNSRNGLPDARRVPLDTHAHGNWAFTAEGRYRLTFSFKLRTRAGRTLRSTATLRVAVGR
jgi:surface-anchored protein